jgi:hypothetical protein
MNEIVSINNNYDEMAKAMGLTNVSSSSDVEKKSANQLARLRLNHTAIMGATEINGKSVNVERVASGSYKLDVPDDATYYQSDIEIRPFMQRFMYKRFIKGNDNTPNRYVKTIMADNLKVDLKDNDGGHNCGKPAGYIQDFDSLPDKQKDLIRQIKRVRVVFGVAKFDSAMRVEGDTITDVDLGYVPFIWEVDNKEAFKTIGSNFDKLSKMKRYPLNHNIFASSEERKLPNGNSYYVPSTRLDITTKIEISDKDQELFGNLLAWITNYNQYIMNLWDENVHSHEEVDPDVVESFIDITSDSEKVQ